MGTLAESEADYQRSTSMFIKGMIRIQKIKKKLEKNEAQNRLRHDEFEQNKENWEAELRVKEVEKRKVQSEIKHYDGRNQKLLGTVNFVTIQY